MSYAGESWAKKMARGYYWNRLRMWMGPERFSAVLHVGLASRECGDHFVVTSLGGRIQLIDKDVSACRSAKDRFGIDVMHADVGEWFRNLGRDGVRRSGIGRDTVRDVAATGPRAIGVAYMVGREGDAVIPLVSRNREHRRAHRKSMANAFYGDNHVTKEAFAGDGNQRTRSNHDSTSEERETSASATLIR